MFPLNLQRNIVQLDREISLLENECKNMVVEKKKKCQRSDSTHGSCGKNSKVQFKAPTVRVTVKKAEGLKKSRRPTPPVSSRMQSTGSLPIQCSRAWCDNDDALVGRKAKLCGLSARAPFSSCQALGSPRNNSKRENKCTKCPCCNDVTESEVGNDDSFDAAKRDHVLLFPNAGGTIEVTVTQKPSSAKEKSPVSQKSPVRKPSTLGKEIDKELDGCRCQFRGQKWSEILCDPKKKPLSAGNCMKNKVLADEARIIYKPSNFSNSRKSEENSVEEFLNNSGSTIQEATFDIPVKLSSQFSKPKKQSEINSNKFEKQIQCSLGKPQLEERTKQVKDPVKIFQMLVNQFQHVSGKDTMKPPIETNTSAKVEDSPKDSDANKNNPSSSPNSQNNVSYTNAVKRQCENLVKEKLLLTEELASKDNMIATLRKREEEYLSLITSLKASLEKTKENAQEGFEVAKQVNAIKSKLLEQMKVSELLKNKVVKLQEDSAQYSYENAKLKTEIRILELEAKKHEIVMAGKDAEINRYREEIQNFQRQIEEHLTSLKSNAQAVDVEKMMEAIMQQSQVFAQTELDSFIEKDEKDSSKLQNVLMHSSPTSTKTSVVNSSWKQISSIHDQDQSRVNSEVIYLNNDQNEKNFFEIFGENSEGRSSKKPEEPLDEKPLENGEVKNSSCFTSCTSMHEDHNTSKSTSRDSLISKETLNSIEDVGEAEIGKREKDFFCKAQSNIDELLRNMKLKFSKEIFETTLPSCTTEDYLDTSHISSISPLG